jgi:hypothetical protein
MNLFADHRIRDDLSMLSALILVSFFWRTCWESVVILTSCYLIKTFARAGLPDTVLRETDVEVFRGLVIRNACSTFKAFRLHSMDYN